VFGYLSVPEGKWFSGIVYNVHDAAQYLSWMREAGHSILTSNRLTSEPNSPVFVNLHWWMAGRLAELLGLSLPAVYEVFRLFSILALSTVLWFATASLLPEWSKRRFCFILATFMSGLGWVWVLLKQFTGDLSFPLDVYVMMGNSLYSMMASPHLTFAAGLTIAVLCLALRGYAEKRWAYSLGAAGLALYLGAGHVYDLVTVWSVLGLFGLLVTLRDGWSWRTFWQLIIIVLVSAPSAIYWGWVSSGTNPVWKQALAQYDVLGVFTPDPPHLAILLGLSFIVAVVTFRGLVPLRLQTDQQLLVKGWFGVTLLLIYLPFRFRIMLLTGYQLPIAVMATWGLFDHILPWVVEHLERLRCSRVISQERLRNWILVLFLIAVLPTNLYLIAWRVNELARHDYPYYLYRDDLRAMHWLEEHTHPEDVVLSSFEIGHYIPGLAGNRTFLANAVMTVNSHRKQELVDAFFASMMSEAEQEAFLQKYVIRYVFYGPAEQALGKFDPRESLLLREVFLTSNTQIYEVQLP
jgi:hypothetical protein